MDTKNTARQDESMERWPALPFHEWKETSETLHMWTQVVGKVRMSLSPHINHWWQVPLYVTARGLTTSLIPYHYQRAFEVQFDLTDHNLLILSSDGRSKILPLMPQSVAEFYEEFMTALRTLGIEVTIDTLPAEVQNPIRCDVDDVHQAYDAEYAHRFWRALVQTQLVMQRFRSRFIGKNSPIHFFWGSFDLAVTRFSGRRAPERPGADHMTREAYSHEVSSCGFWPGNESFPEPVFYSYTIPEPPGFKEARVLPDKAFYSNEVGEFMLRYEDVRTSATPEQDLLNFFQSTYEVGATLGNWDRKNLER
ncbi:MAG TPA: DUF5996 family protein [Ktedonobacteraceae bacterium]|nr:DUF5996 family protein [Ktedonobacteraceae bacterium]